MSETPLPFSGDSAREPLPTAFIVGISDRFTIGREIGRGGMSTVWLAHRVGEDTPLAIKVLRPILADAIPAQRFLREIRIASAFDSSALVPLLESGEAAGLPYYLMPYAEGGSLRDLMRRERHLRIDEAVAITRTVATGLAVLHRGGFVHRDIKPGNVLLTSDRQALLADYGIAHALTVAARDDLTSTGVVLGTPPYMSPEQASGLSVDGRSDIYSLGCLLYEMLSGETPFHGATPQAILARHLHDSPPSLRVVRATIPEALEAIVMRMLAKVPTDRFQTADELLAAFDEAGHLTDDLLVVRRDAVRRRRRFARRLLPIAVVGAIASLSWFLLRGQPLDPDRVIVFPFATIGSSPEPGWAQLPMLVGSALERTASTTWLDGYSMLSENERATLAGLTSRRSRSLARRARARYYVDGAVSRAGEMLTVQVRLNDAESGLVLESRTESGRGLSAGELALRGVVQVLPTLTGLEQVVDVSGLTSHDPAAIENWLHGEREYRLSRMGTALQYLQRAVAADSLLAPAAFRAAVTANWISRPESAQAYIRLALRHPEALPPRQRPFAFALERLLRGRADESMESLWPSLKKETESSDAWMLAGEILLHLLPTVSADPTARTSVPLPTTWPTEAFAQQAFERARALDPAFSPPLAHLAEIAARRGDGAGLLRAVRALGLTDADSVLLLRTTVMERCLRVGPSRVDWSEVHRRRPATLFHVGFALWGGASPVARGCARAAFAASLAADVKQGPEDWGSLLGFHGMLVAEGKNERALQIVDSAVAAGLGAALGLYVVDASAGLEIGTRADAFVAQLVQNIETRAAPSLWLLTLWRARSNDVADLERINRLLTARSAASGQRLDSLITSVSAAYLTLARGDSSGALRAFAALRPTAGSQQLESSLWEALAPERLILARLLLARGDPTEAHRVASTFDQPTVLVHGLFLRQSLEVRAQAARALQDTTLERVATDRLSSLRAASP